MIDNPFPSQAFNEELDGMFNDAALPEDEAWAAMTRDLTEAKMARTEMERKNLCVITHLYSSVPR